MMQGNYLIPGRDDMSELLVEVRSLQTIDWYLKASPSAEDFKCLQLIEEVAVGPRDRSLGDDHELSVRIQTFVFRMSELCVRTRSSWVLEVAAKGLALDGCVERESFSLLALVYRSAVILGLDGNHLLQTAARYGTPDAEKRFLEFIGRVDEEKATAKMGFVETTRDGMFAYQFDVRVALPPDLKK